MTPAECLADGGLRRVETWEGRPALRHRGHLVVSFSTPSRYEGQEERFAKETAELEEWIELMQNAPQVLADRDRLAAELATSGPSCDRCQSSHCCSVAGHTPPLCVTDPEGSLPLWMPWTNEDVRKRVDAVYAQVDRLTGELARVRRNHLRRMAEATWDRLIHLQHGLIAQGVMDAPPHKRMKARMTRFAERCRAALAQLQDGTTEVRG